MVCQGANSTYLQPKWEPLHVNNDVDEIYFLDMRLLGDVEMIGEQLSNSHTSKI